MADPVVRFLLKLPGGLASVQLHPHDDFRGPRDRYGHAVCRVTAEGVPEEAASGRDRAPWFRRVDRERAILDLRADGQSRTVLEHAASTPVASFGECNWIELTFVEGGPPWTAEVLSEEGGIVPDAELPMGVDRAVAEGRAKAVPRDDPHRRQRVRTLLKC